MLADIASGEVDVADILFLVAFILFVIVAVIHALARELTGVLMCAGFAALALAWLLL